MSANLLHDPNNKSCPQNDPDRSRIYCEPIPCTCRTAAGVEPSAKAHEIVITMEGGVIQDIEHIPAGVEVVVMDFDEISDDDKDERIHTNDQGQKYYRSEW